VGGRIQIQIQIPGGGRIQVPGGGRFQMPGVIPKIFRV
jgi:hypothetical protein